MSKLQPLSISAGLSIALALGAAFGCSGEAGRSSVEPRLVLLYATCTVNRSHLSPYDPARPYTPNIARFAEQAAVLERHHTESGQSGVAFASLFTGLQAPGHGVFYHPRPLSPDLDLISEHFSRAGYETHSWLQHKMADASLGYAQGVPESRRHDGMLLFSSRAFSDLLNRLAEDPSLQAFVVTNFTVTHAPYTGHALDDFCTQYAERCEARALPSFERWKKLYTQRHNDFAWNFEGTVGRIGLSQEQQREIEAVVSLLYEADVFFLDRLFGGVLDAIERRGLLDRSIVVFTADHGEIGIRNNAPFRWTHGMQLAPEVLQVPMIIRAPGSDVLPSRYPGVTRSIDVLPTLVGLAELPPAERARGVDLSAALRGEAPAPGLVAWSHTAMFSPEWRGRMFDRYPLLAARFPSLDPELLWTAARRGDDFFELRRDDGADGQLPHLYLLDRDPGKREDAFDASSPDHRSMQSELKSYLAELAAAYRAGDGTGVRLPEEETAERLRSLGYLE